MIFLKNKKAWSNFSRGEDFLNSGAPKEFPCVAYTMAGDWGMERQNVYFLYADDIFKLAMKFRAEIKQ